MAMAAALAKVIRGGGSRASQSQLLLLPAMGRSRGPQEGFARGLLPAMGPTAPASTAAASPPLLRAPASTAAASPPLLRKVPSPCLVTPWRFHSMACLQSSTHTGEQLARVPPPSPADANKEYAATIQKLYRDLEDMEASLKKLENLRWLCTFFLLYYAVSIIPEQLVRFWYLRKDNSKLARELSEGIKGAEELNDEIAHHHDELRDLQQAAASVTPVPAIPSAATPSSDGDCEEKGNYAPVVLFAPWTMALAAWTSVPSYSPDDFMALQDLVTKPALIEKYGVKNGWVPHDVVPIIHIPEFMLKSAEKACLDLKSRSQNDREKLAEAKRMTYLKGFTDGTMIVGAFIHSKVQEAKLLIKRKVLEEGTEPEKKGHVQSGDECVVALTDQWYLTYGDADRKQQAARCLDGMNSCFVRLRDASGIGCSARSLQGVGVLLCHTATQSKLKPASHGFERILGWLNKYQICLFGTDGVEESKFVFVRGCAIV
ncbi:hypothetical protein EJB05_01043 [Eragrostis curvula]|uniref:Uncharacterized protein n=1 Tax=Eragrostis curvula TaxID=38414 RepID=A0A5J9WP33_9POAL|nr:hypothetical protein EJB05_01043 [Eragrostis curvula]